MSELSGTERNPGEEFFAWIEGSRVRIGIFYGVMAIIGAWLLVWFLLPQFYPNREQVGQLGDSFGLLTCLFIGLTLLGAGYAVYAQNEQLKIAREQVEDGVREQRENQRIQESQAKAQRAASELNAYDSLVQPYSRLAEPGPPTMIGNRPVPPGVLISDGPDPYAQDQVRKLLQMTKVVLSEIQNPEGEFDWRGTPPEERTRFRKFHLCGMREAKVRYESTPKFPLMANAVMPLLREIKSEFELTLMQEGLTHLDRIWAHKTLTFVNHAFQSSRDIQGVPDQAYRLLMDSLILDYPDV